MNKDSGGRPGRMTYRSAGVDLEAAADAKAGIARAVRAAKTKDVLSGEGAFGGLFRAPRGMKDPVLVSSVDGVGTKALVAIQAGRYDTIGRDLVHHCVNDILVQGARPLFFMDYIAAERIDPAATVSLVEGIHVACRENDCALLGGETAEMGDLYRPGGIDLAGFIVGVVERERLLDGSKVREGDKLLAIPSSGLHTNGYTLARRIVEERLGLGPEDWFPGEERSVSEVLLAVHRSYLAPIAPLLAKGWVRAMAHVTGGGIQGNLPRVLPQGLGAEIQADSWETPNVFRVLGRAGRVKAAEMYRVFNMGVGMILVVAPDIVHAARAELGEGWIVGDVVRGDGARLEGAA